MKKQLGCHPLRIRRFIPTLYCVVCTGFLTSVVNNVNAQGKGSAAPQGAPKTAPTTGYLNKTAPSGLRFAAPPKPPVAYLPPLPITYDPQPVFSADFANPMADLPKPPADNGAPPIQAPTSVPVTELMTQFKDNRAKIPGTPVDAGAVNPQMLIKFFQDGRPPATEVWVGDPVHFKVPVKDERRSSSATYQVK